VSAGTSVQQVSTAQVVAAGAQSGTAVTEMGNEADVCIAVTVAGTTVTPVIQTSPDGGTTWFDHTTLAAITTVSNVLTKISANAGKLMRIDYRSVTGSFTISAWIVCKRGAV
jgi:hypothetical protein